MHWYTLTVTLAPGQDADVARSILEGAAAKLRDVHRDEATVVLTSSRPLESPRIVDQGSPASSGADDRWRRWDR